MSPSGRWFTAGEEAVYRHVYHGPGSEPSLAARTGQAVIVQGICEDHPDTEGYRRPFYAVRFPDGEVLVAAANELRRPRAGNPPGRQRHPKRVEDALYRLMLEAFGCGPIDGGCVTTARGICQALGGEMYTLEGRSGFNASEGAQHALCKVGERYWDGEGAWTAQGILDHWGKVERLRDGRLRPWREGDLQGEAPDDPVVAAKVASLFRSSNPAGPFWDDLSEEERQAHRMRVDQELRAIGARKYPCAALWGPGGEEVTVLGPARRFPPYDDPAYGPKDHRGDFQLMAARPDGRQVILMANHLRDPATRAPWLTPSPGLRDPRGPLERLLERQGNPGPIPPGILREIQAAATRAGSTGLGVRRDDDAYAVGDILPPSRLWDDGEPTEEVLDGTSAIDPRKAPLLSQYLGRYLYLLAGDYHTYGQDEGEVILRPAKVIDMWDLGRQGNPQGGHPAVRAFWAQLMEEAPSCEDWEHGVDLLDDDVTVNLEQAKFSDDPEVWIEMIESRDRGSGKASKALRYLTSLADRHGITLLLVPDAQDEEGLTTEALRAWYGRHGFQPFVEPRFGFGADAAVMKRPPRQENSAIRCSGKMLSIPLDEDLREDLSSILRIHSYPPTPGMLAFWEEYRAGTKELHKGSGWSHSLHNDQVVLDLRMDPTQGTIHIVEVKAIDKRTGAGTRALEFLTRLADKHGVTLSLVAQRLGKDGMGQGDLVRWYRRHGFQRHGRHGWDMRRKPR